MEKIILFGTGKYFQHKKALFTQYEVACIIDNRIMKGAYETHGISGAQIINPSDLDRTGTEPVYLMTMNFVSMWKQLVSLGIHPARIIYPFFVKPYFQSDDVVDAMVEKIEFGAENFCVIEKNGSHTVLTSQEEWDQYLRRLYRSRFGIIDAIAAMDTIPISKQFATERGKPVDRVYIERFLEREQEYIANDVLEIEDAAYTRRFGGDRVVKSVIMDVSSDSPEVDFHGNIETGEGIREAVADCFILTQTLMYIYDLESAAKSIVKLLKPGGVALITCSCLSQNSRRCMDNYGAYFNFNAAVFEKMFRNENVSVLRSGSHGNVKTVLAHLAGLCAEDLSEKDFDEDDQYYPLIVYTVVKKDA